MLRSRAKLNDWTLVPMSDLTLNDVATVMSEAAICLSFGLHEGFGLANLEALASGCRLIGYHGYGGQELFANQHGVAVAPADIPSFVSAIESAAQMYKNNPSEFFDITEETSDWVRLTYNIEREREDLRKIYSPLMARNEQQSSLSEL
jgi:glycosyltransferase involved in cell wall biosynthesis